MLGLVATEQREDAWHALKVRVVSNTGEEPGRTQDEWCMVYHSQMIQSHGGEGNYWNFPTFNNNFKIVTWHSWFRQAWKGMSNSVPVLFLYLTSEPIGHTVTSRFQTELPDIFWDYRDKCAEKMFLRSGDSKIPGVWGRWNFVQWQKVYRHSCGWGLQGSLFSTAWRTSNLVWAFGHCAQCPVGRYIPKPRSFFGRKAAIKKSRTYPNEALLGACDSWGIRL